MITKLKNNKKPMMIYYQKWKFQMIITITMKIMKIINKQVILNNLNL